MGIKLKNYFITYKEKNTKQKYYYNSIEELTKKYNSNIFDTFHFRISKNNMVFLDLKINVNELHYLKNIYPIYFGKLVFHSDDKEEMLNKVKELI